MTSIVFQPLFLNGTQQRLTPELLDEMIRERQELMREHREHKLMIAFTEMLDLEAARFTAAAIDEDVANREHKAGQAAGVNYIAHVMRLILDYQPEAPDVPDAASSV